MLVYLLRHGRAEDGFGMADSDRALTDDGWGRLREAAPAWGRLIAELGVIVQSPLRRAQETATVLAEATGRRSQLRTDARIAPSSDPAHALELIAAELHAGTGAVAFVGHEPHLGRLLGLLLTGDPHRSVPLKKGMLVAVEVATATTLIGTLQFALSQRAATRLG